MSPIRILKASQSDKIREINMALEVCQITSLGDKAYVLGLPRSTTFTIGVSNTRAAASRPGSWLKCSRRPAYLLRSEP